MATIGADGNSL